MRIDENNEIVISDEEWKAEYHDLFTKVFDEGLADSRLQGFKTATKNATKEARNLEIALMLMANAQASWEIARSSMAFDVQLELNKIMFQELKPKTGFWAMVFSLREKGDLFKVWAHCFTFNAQHDYTAGRKT